MELVLDALASSWAADEALVLVDAQLWMDNRDQRMRGIERA